MQIPNTFSAFLVFFSQAENGQNFDGELLSNYFL